MKRRIHYGNRYDVSAWIPSPEIARIAEERTEGLVGYFLSCASRAPVKWQDQLHVLARSCYMQGLNDMAAAAALRCKRKE
jgi:hypothetical protein